MINWVPVMKPKQKSSEGRAAEYAKNSENQARREFLNSGLALATSGLAISTMSVARANEVGFSLGENPFVDTKLYHEIPEDESLGTAEGLRNYSVDTNADRMGLLSPKTDLFENEVPVISADGILVPKKTEIFGNTTTALMTTPNKHKSMERILLLEEEYERPTLNIGDVIESKITGDIEDRKFSVSAGEERNLELSSKEVIVTEDKTGMERTPDPDNSEEEHAPDPEYKTISVNPKLRIRHNGILRVFGKQGYYTVPINQNDPFSRQFIKLWEDKQSAKKIQEDGADLFVVKWRGE